MVEQGYEQPRFGVSSGVSSSTRRAQNLMSGKHSVLREVGLGTNDPTKAMHMVKETSGAAYMSDRYQNTEFAGAFITRSARGTETAPLAAADDDDLGTLWAYGYAGATNGFQQAGWLQFEVDGSVSDAVHGVPGRIVFKTSDGSGSFSEVVRIDKSGNVGIGITPTNKLHVVGNIQLNTRGEMRFADADSSHYTGIKSAATVSSSHTYTLPAAFPASSKVLQSTDAGILSWETAGAGEVNESSFKTISVSGQDNVVADADDDTLTFAAAGGITLTTTAASDTVTISSADTNTQLTTEQVQDIVGGMLTGNTETRISVTYEDGDGTIDFAVDDMTANTQLTQEQVEDFAGALVASGGTKTGISVTYQDGTGDMDFAVSDLTVAGDSGSTGMTPGDTLTIAGGTNISTAMSGDTLTINQSGGGEANENSFETIAVSGQDNVVADSTTDTLTFAAGSNVTITTTAASDTVTIASTDTNTTYSAGTLLDLSTTTFNVDLTEASEQAIANGDYILFLDGGATGTHAKEAVADVATLFAGDGLTASSSVMAVNVDDSTIETSSDAIRVKDNGVTLAKMAGLSRGTIIYGDASGDPAALAVGDADQVLTHDGTDISWEDAGGGSGSARSVAGDTDNAIISWVTSDNTFAAEANLLYDGNSLTMANGSASAIPLKITAHASQSADLLVVEKSDGSDYVNVGSTGSIVMGLAGTRVIQTKEESGTNTAGKDIFVKAGKSTGNAEGGDVRFYTSPVGSSGSSVNGWAEALKIRHDKVVDFKKAGGAKTVTLLNDAMDLYMSGGATVTVNATEWLEIKVNGNTRYIPVWS